MFFAINVLTHMERDDPSKRKRTPEELSRAEPPGSPGGTESVRLIRKYAEMIDGVNLEAAQVGDRLRLSKRDADVLIAEGWAERAPDDRPGRLLPRRAQAADAARRRKPKN
jgi:hypothetical protein